MKNRKSIFILFCLIPSLFLSLDLVSAMWDPPTEPVTPLGYNFSNDLELQTSFQHMDFCDNLWGVFECMAPIEEFYWVQIAFSMPAQNIHYIAFQLQNIGAPTFCRVTGVGDDNPVVPDIQTYPPGTIHTWILPTSGLDSNNFVLKFDWYLFPVGALIKINFMGVYDNLYNPPSYPYTMGV